MNLNYKREDDKIKHNDHQFGFTNVKMLGTSVALVVLGLLAFESDIRSLQIPKTQCKTAKNSINCMDFQWSEINIRSNKKDWKVYINEGLDVLSEWASKQEKTIMKKFFQALIEHESNNWNSNAKSPTGARGLGQVTQIVFQDMLQHHRKKLYQDRFRLIVYKKPELLIYLPWEVRTTLRNFLHNATDENWAIFESRLSFYAHEAKMVDPHTNLLICMVYYDIIYDNLDLDNIDNFFIKHKKKIWKTPHDLPKGVNYGDFMKKHISAAYRYNGSASIVDLKYNIAEREAYPTKVMKIFLKNSEASHKKVS